MITKVDLKISQLLSDLASGLSWYKSEDLGCGSIEEKYKANAFQISIIKQHPLLVNAVTSAIVFNLIDDVTDNKIVTEETKETIKEKNTNEKLVSNVKEEEVAGFSEFHSL